MKFGQFVPYYKRKNFIEKFYKNCDLKTSSRPFCIPKELRQALLENDIFETSCLYWICISKAIKMCPNHHIDLVRFHFTEDSLNIKKD